LRQSAASRQKEAGQERYKASFDSVDRRFNTLKVLRGAAD
jgi:hypothetical protein